MAEWDEDEGFRAAEGRPDGARRDNRGDGRGAGRSQSVDELEIQRQRDQRRGQQAQKEPPQKEPRPQRPEPPSPKQQKQSGGRQQQSDTAVVNRATLKRMKPKVKRNIAFFLMALTLISNWFGSAGMQSTKSTNFFAIFFAQFTIVGAVVGTLFFAVITFFQWIWADEWTGIGWLSVTAASTALFVRGFWWIGTPFVGSILTFFMRGDEPPIALVNGLTAIFLAVLSLLIDIWPERVLVGKE